MSFSWQLEVRCTIEMVSWKDWAQATEKVRDKVLTYKWSYHVLGDETVCIQVQVFVLIHFLLLNIFAAKE